MTSLAWGAPGLALQIIAGVLVLETQMLGLIAMLCGTLLLLVGLGYYAKAKGYHPVWGLLGALSWVGLLLLAVLPDRAQV
jgi:hypothetical protein